MADLELQNPAQGATDAGKLAANGATMAAGMKKLEGEKTTILERQKGEGVDAFNRHFAEYQAAFNRNAQARVDLANAVRKAIGIEVAAHEESAGFFPTA